MKEFYFEVFGRNVLCSTNLDIAAIEEQLQTLLKKVSEPFIFDVSDLFYPYWGTDCNSATFVDIVRWAAERHGHSNDNLIDYLLSVSDEDADWTEERNRGLTDIYYHKLKLHDDVAQEIANVASAKLEEAKQVIDKINEEKAAAAAAKKEREQRWTKVLEYKFLPAGKGQDGYLDADYRSADGDIIRFVSRDVFDFGCYSYPKRLEGTEDALNNGTFSGLEIDLMNYLAEFGPFHNVRI